MSAHALVSRHVAAALAEADGRSIDEDVVARCLLSEAIRLFKRNRPSHDVAAELVAAADNLDDDAQFPFMRP
jgi:hypothetical protein